MARAKLRIVRILLSALLMNSFFFASAPQSHADACPTFNFDTLFDSDWYPPTAKWNDSSGHRVITWSPNATVITSNTITRPFTPIEVSWLETVFDNWSHVLDTIQFKKVQDYSTADITIGYAQVEQPPGKSRWIRFIPTRVAGFITHAEMALNPDLTPRMKQRFGIDWSDRNSFIHAVEKDVGNILGIGQIEHSVNFQSVTIVPAQQPINIDLTEVDKQMMRQLYGQSTCPSSFPAAAVSGSPIPAPAPTVTSTPRNISKVTVIICAKGKILKKFTGDSPKCPSGYVKK
jgi:hypothetical protein